jgi:hypothetical protein
MKLPIEIINKILLYLSEINNDIITIQYNQNNNKLNEYYIINKASNNIINIESINIMKRCYPLYNCINITSPENIELYKYGKMHYINILKNLK